MSVKNMTHSYRTRKSTLEYKLDCDKNSNPNARTQVPPGIESRRNGEFNKTRTIKSEPDSRTRIGRVSKLSPTSKGVDVDTAAPPGVVAHRTYLLLCCSIDVLYRKLKILQVRVPRVVCSHERHPIWHELR